MDVPVERLAELSPEIPLCDSPAKRLGSSTARDCQPCDARPFRL